MAVTLGLPNFPPLALPFSNLNVQTKRSYWNGDLIGQYYFRLIYVKGV